MYFELEEDRDTDIHEVGRGREKLKKNLHDNRTEKRRQRKEREKEEKGGK